LSGGFFVDPSDLEELTRYARSRGFIDPDEQLIGAEKAGEGNMNLTLRLKTPTRSIVLKQARPWVEKYPDIAAPADRALVETKFYETIQNRRALRDAMPRLLGSDPPSRVLILEDLGRAQDFTGLYASSTMSLEDLSALVSYLATLHEPFSLDEDARARFLNREMRALNHEHIFCFPLLDDNGLDLDAITPGLQSAAQSLKNDGEYVRVVARLGELYLKDGPALVHGDYFPGSWLRTEHGVRVIDPEFCFLGEPAFDVGFMLGHLYLADQPEELRDALLELYRSRDEDFPRLARQFGGVEIMRRLIGVAQLPLTCGLEKKKQLLATSRDLVVSPPI
jgi:5-methylthioribose kinase